MNFLNAQPANTDCSGAVHICPGKPVTMSNSGAGSGSFNSSCHASNNATWYKFSTNNKGGNVSVNISSSCDSQGTKIGATLFESSSDCSGFNEITCDTVVSANLNLNASSLDSLKKYYIVLNSENNGQSVDCEFKVSVTGEGIKQSSTTEIEDVICFQKKGNVIIKDVVMGQGPLSYSNGDIQKQNSPEFSELNVGLHTVVITDANGCEQEVSFYVNDTQNNLTVNAGDDKVIIEGGSTQLSAQGNGGSYLWNPPAGLNDVNSQTPIASPAGTQSYEVYTYSPENCQTHDVVIVKVLPRIIIPTAFTPNGDGTNDTWRIRFIENYPDCIIDVYNRWGQKVFSSEGYGKGQEWEGKSLGVDLPTATYYYVIDLNAKTDEPEFEFFRGAVTIIR